MKKTVLLSLLFFISGCSVSNVSLSNNFINDRNNDFNMSLIDKKIEYSEFTNKSNILKTIIFFENLNNNLFDIKNKTKFEKISTLNNFFNSEFSYIKDSDNYGLKDYWASIYEMIQSGFKGDCEDFTFGKIQLAEMYLIDKKDILIGFTKDGKHIFPIFFDGSNYVVSDTNGRLKTLESYVQIYPDLKVYSYSEIFTTKDLIFNSKGRSKILVKVTGFNS